MKHNYAKTMIIHKPNEVLKFVGLHVNQEYVTFWTILNGFLIIKPSKGIQSCTFKALTIYQYITTPKVQKTELS